MSGQLNNTDPCGKSVGFGSGGIDGDTGEPASIHPPSSSHPMASNGNNDRPIAVTSKESATTHSHLQLMQSPMTISAPALNGGSTSTSSSAARFSNTSLIKSRLENLGVIKLGKADHHLEDDGRLRTFSYKNDVFWRIIHPMILMKNELGSATAALVSTHEDSAPIFSHFMHINQETTSTVECDLRLRGEVSEQQEFFEEPILSLVNLQFLKRQKNHSLRCKTINLTFRAEDGERGLMIGINRVCQEARGAAGGGAKAIILSDRGVDSEHLPISSILAVAAVRRSLEAAHLRNKVSLVCETGEARVLHDIAVLLNFGADSICPYMVYETCFRLRTSGMLPKEITDDEVFNRYRDAIDQGLIMKMMQSGISTLTDYKNAALFEVVGFGEEVIELCFEHKVTRRGWLSFDMIAREAMSRHRGPNSPPEGMKRGVKEECGTLETEIITLMAPALRHDGTGERVVINGKKIRLEDESFGRWISEELEEYHGTSCEDHKVNILLTGNGGFSFGSHLLYGLTVKLFGSTSDFMGQSLSGGIIIVRPPTTFAAKSEEKWISGHSALFNAASGSAYIRGVAGDRFAFANEGATAVVEGVGSHCCQSMSNGRVIVLGKIGPNFGSFMSGGMGFIFRNDDWNQSLIDTAYVCMVEPNTKDLCVVKDDMARFVFTTDSELGKRILANWEAVQTQIIKVIPKRAVQYDKEECHGGSSKDGQSTGHAATLRQRSIETATGGDEGCSGASLAKRRKLMIDE